MKSRVLLPAVIFVLLLVLIFTAGCSKKNDSAKPESGQRFFAVSFQTMNNPFFVDLNKGIKEVVEAHGDRLVTLDAQWNSLKQRNDISDMILQGVSGIFINPVNWEGIKGSLLQAKHKGIPCVVVDAPVKNVDLVLCQVASDNVEAGRLAARALAQSRRPAKIVILHLSVNKACIDRVAGFKEELSKYPDMEIIDIQEGKGTTEGARPVMRDLLGRYPKLNAVFPINDPSALGVISALESAGKLKDVTVVTVDGSDEGVAALRFNEGRPMHISDHHTIFLALGNGRLFGVVPVPVIVMLTLFVLTAVLLHRTRFGQHLYAIGGNRQAARFTGIALVRIEIMVYVICSVLTGIAGMIHTSQLYSAEPASGVMFELNAIAAAVVGGTSFTGGRGTMYGTLIGAIIIGILDKGLNQAGIHFSLQYIVKGLVILSAVYVDVRRRK